MRSRGRDVSGGALVGGVTVVGVLALAFCVFAAGAGHGSYLPAKILFPLTMLSTLVFNRITAVFAIVAVVQFPLYGVVLATGRSRGRGVRTLVVLTALHLIEGVACVLLVRDKW